MLFCYVNPQERKPQAQRDWLDLLQGRAHNVHKVDVCALSLLCKSPRTQAAGAARLAGFTARAGAQCPQSGRLCVELAAGDAAERDYLRQKIACIMARTKSLSMMP